MKSDIDTYKVDHLFLLVGKNPLPNYVVAKSGLLLREKGKPYLVYTTDTEKYAHKLRDKLGITNQELISIEQSQSDAFVIQSRIKEKAEELPGRLGLNYTGGTKAMSVNSYIAIKSIKRDEEPVFSYLDPYSVRLLIDRNDRFPQPQEIDLQPNLTDIFELHTQGFRKSKCRSFPILPNLLPHLAEFSTEWNSWRNNDEPIEDVLDNNCEDIISAESLPPELLKVFEDADLISHPETGIHLDKLRRKLKLSKHSSIRTLLSDRSEKPIPCAELPSQLLNALSKEDLLEQDNKVLSVTKLLAKAGFKSAKESKDWLTGNWLEDFVLLQVKEMSNEFGASFDVPLPGSSQFEFDVAFLRGYQLFAFSCTTSSDFGRCKQKLFEAHLRAKQLGGEEARVALVCCSDKPDFLRQQFQAAIADRTINVFGRHELNNLADHVAAWMREIEV